MKRAIIFIDANNWYHNVKRFFQPGDIDIIKLVNYLCNLNHSSPVEIRWYASTPSITDGEAMYYKHLSFLQSLQKKSIRVITRKLQRFSNNELSKKRLETLDNLHLCKICRPLVESVFLDIAEVKKKEKGIDVWIAIDMIKKSVINDECDLCILISGDSDFVPALDLIKHHNKEVITSMVPWGYSSELRQKFKYFILTQEILRTYLKGYKESKEGSTPK